MSSPLCWDSIMQRLRFIAWRAENTDPLTLYSREIIRKEENDGVFIVDEFYDINDEIIFRQARVEKIGVDR